MKLGGAGGGVDGGGLRGGEARRGRVLVVRPVSGVGVRVRRGAGHVMRGVLCR